MKRYVITVSDEYGLIKHSDVFIAKNGSDAVKKAMDSMKVDYGDTIELFDEQEYI